MFWHQLVRLSRQDHVTIFVSTPFMNETERCNRNSLMHRGLVLAVGSSNELHPVQGEATLEDAFVAHLQAADLTTQAAQAETMPHQSNRTALPSNRLALLWTVAEALKSCGPNCSQFRWPAWPFSSSCCRIVAFAFNAGSTSLIQCTGVYP